MATHIERPQDHFEDREDLREARDHMTQVEYGTEYPSRLANRFRNMIHDGLSTNQLARMEMSGGPFEGIDPHVDVDPELKDELNAVIAQIWMDNYEAGQREMPVNETRMAVFEDFWQQRMVEAARNTIPLIISIAGSSRRHAQGFEIEARARGKQRLSWQDLAMIQVAVGQMAENLDDSNNEVIQLAFEITNNPMRLSPRALGRISELKRHAASAQEVYEASADDAEREGLADRDIISSEAKQYGALLMLMSQPQLAQLVEHELKNPDVEDATDQVYMLAMNTRIAPTVVERLIRERAAEIGLNTPDGIRLMELIGRINQDRPRMTAIMHRVEQYIIENVKAQSVSSGSDAKKIPGMLAMFGGAAMMALNLILMVPNSKHIPDLALYVAGGAAMVAGGASVVSGERFTQPFERWTRGIFVSRDSLAEYGQEATANELADITAREVGMDITRDFYSQPTVIALLRQLTNNGTEAFELSTFERSLENNPNIPEEARAAYQRYKAAVDEEYLQYALNFTAHSYELFEINNQREYLQHAGRRVGMRPSDLESSNSAIV